MGEQTASEKLAALLSSNCYIKVADHTPLKSGVGIPESNQKVEPRSF
jgi:hypothetical protein